MPLPDPEEIAQIKREKAEQAARDAEKYERQRQRAPAREEGRASGNASSMPEPPYRPGDRVRCAVRTAEDMRGLELLGRVGTVDRAVLVIALAGLVRDWWSTGGNDRTWESSHPRCPHETESK
jgi:hypothetical protein